MWYLFLDSLDLSEFDPVVYNLVFYFDNYYEIVYYDDLRKDPFGRYPDAIELLPTEDDINKIKKFLIKVGYGYR